MNQADAPVAPAPATEATPPVPTAPPPLPVPVGAASAPAIAARDLTMRYGQLLALDRLNLELEAGDVYGFIGPNGAGKTTTMKILAGLLRPTAGDAYIMGRQVAGNGQFVRCSVGYMPDTFGVYEDLKVSEYLEFFASAYGIPRGRRKKIVADVLDLTDLKYKQDALVDSLSRGMQQRLGLARVLVHDPPVLLLDEPASGLDPRARIEIRELLRELQRLGKTILVSSHILSELGEFCNKLGIIERGKLLVSGTIGQLQTLARTQPVISLRVLEHSEAAAALLKGDARVAAVETIDGDLRVTLHDPGLHHHFLIEKLMAANLRIDRIAPHDMKLEDVFLRLTKGLVQ
jgi:ABC-2 type transport system ATP-binding protein